GPRRVALDADVAPATIWNPAVIGGDTRPSRDPFVRSPGAAAPLPAAPAEIAFAPGARVPRRIEHRTRTPQPLPRIYLERIARLDPRIRSVITLTRDVALAAAKAADAEIAAGKYRGPLHGIPYGVKDLLDTANIATTYGAEPFRTRVPASDSVVVRR